MSSTLHEDKAIQYMQQADKLFTKKGWFGFGGGKFDEAAELYQKAGNSFKLAKKFQEAGGAFTKMAECHMKLQSPAEAASAYVEASHAYKKSAPLDAIKCLSSSIEIFTDVGRFQQVAKHYKEIAELYEGENDLERAIENYNHAADFFEGEDSTSSANTCLLKVALYSAQLGNFTRAIEIYEQVAGRSLDNSLLKWSVKDYFWKAIVCSLATGQLDETKSRLARYQDMDMSFQSTRECEFLTNIVDAYEQLDPELFADHAREYDSVSKLDGWATNILLRIKNDIKKGEVSVL
eukprot:GFYU01000214.1.p1 GENE.GFYU01000214.1~~GFYU01000214.1.p1  ORF type:complete len:292 (+),score=69.57 GFYU01000214.1:25-900(+)